MPKAAISDHLRRVWRLLDILPPPGEGKTKTQLNEELSHEFDVTLKTTERDLQFLLEEGFAVTVPGKSYDGLKSKMVWQQAPDKSLTLHRMLQTDNALAFHLIDQVAEKLLPPEVKFALAKVRTKAKDRLRERRNIEQKARWAEKVQMVPEGFALQPPSLRAEDILPNLQTALLKDLMIRGEHASLRSGTPKPFFLEPRGLWMSGHLLYVVVTDPSQDLGPDAYQYRRLDRFLSLEVTEEPVRQTSFKLQEFLGAGGSQFVYRHPTVHFRAKAARNVWSRLGETKIAPNQKLTATPDPEQMYIEADVIRSDHFMMWLLSHGPEIEVLEPASLREEVATKLKLAAAAYDAPAATQKP